MSRSTATRIALLLTGALIGAALIAPAGAASKKDLKQAWKYVRKKLSAEGTINAAKNPVDWSKLKNVPVGLADGIDDRAEGACSAGAFVVEIDADGELVCDTPGGGGDITGVTAGTGLTGGGDSGSVMLAADTSYLQRRVEGDCAAPNAVTAVNQDGTVECGNATSAIAGFKDGGMAAHEITNVLSTIATLDLPGGRYAVFAKLYLNNFDNATRTAACTLGNTENLDFDQTIATAPALRYASMAMMIVTNLTAPSQIVVECVSSDNPTDLRYAWVKVTAIPLSSLANGLMP